MTLLSVISLPVEDAEDFMKCPGRNGQICAQVIAKAVTCTGANKGKFFRKCDACGLFEWVRPSEIFSGSQMPSSPLAAHPPIPNPPIPRIAGHPLFQIDPALLPTAIPVLPLSTPPPSQFPVTVNKPKKKTCARPSCGHVAAASCSNSMCKGCCEKSGVVCFFKNHNGGQRPVSTSTNPAHLPRPLPSIPILPPTPPHIGGAATAVPVPSHSASVSAETATPAFVPDEFNFKKPVPDALAQDYLRRVQEREQRQLREAMRAENQRRLRHSVLLVAYLADDGDALMIPLQDIPTWPTLNLSQLPDLPKKLGGIDLSQLELFVVREGFWISTLDYAMLVKTDEKVFVRKNGLLSGPLAQPQLPLALFELPLTPARKRQASSPASSPPPSKLPCHEPESSPHCWIPSSSLAPAAAVPQEESLTVVVELDNQGNVVDAHDRNWALGFVLTSDDDTWPRGMFVRDMAKGFELLASGSRSILAERFPRVFPGKPYKHSAFFKNRNFWFDLPAHVRRQARNLPRTEDGLWVKWRKQQPGWK